jgi:hypothetical protein
MYQLSKIAIQPLPYSNSLLYMLLKNNSEFNRWYSSFDFINNKYLYSNTIQKYEYNICFQYSCINNNFNYKCNDIINSSLTLKHNDNIYNEFIKQEIQYTKPYDGPYCNWDYEINTNYIIKKNGEIDNDIDLIKTISNNKL